MCAKMRVPDAVTAELAAAAAVASIDAPNADGIDVCPAAVGCSSDERPGNEARRMCAVKWQCRIALIGAKAATVVLVGSVSSASVGGDEDEDEEAEDEDEDEDEAWSDSDACFCLAAAAAAVGADVDSEDSAAAERVNMQRPSCGHGASTKHDWRNAAADDAAVALSLSPPLPLPDGGDAHEAAGGKRLRRAKGKDVNVRVSRHGVQNFRAEFRFLW
jgi:hypothetical protein